MTNKINFVIIVIENESEGRKMVFFIKVCLVIIFVGGTFGFALDKYDRIQRDRRYSRIDFLLKHPNYTEDEDGNLIKRQ